MKEKRNGQITFLDSLLKQNNGKISVLVHRKPTDTDQYSLKQALRKVQFPPCSIEYIPLSPIKMN